MGLANDPNKVLKVPNVRKNLLKLAKEGKDDIEVDTVTTKQTKKFEPKKGYVAEKLEQDAKWPRARLLRLPNSEVEFATYMMDKHGDDYAAMEKDRKNFYQYTRKQIMQKIKRFKSIPEQYAEYLVKKGEIVLDNPEPLKKIKPQDILKEPIVPSTNTKNKKRKKRKASLLDSARNEIIDEDAASDLDFDTNKTLNDDNQVLDKSVKSKKLKLFEESDED